MEKDERETAVIVESKESCEKVQDEDDNNENNKAYVENHKQNKKADDSPAIKETLISMGFPENLVNQALLQTKDIQEAVSIICIMQSDPMCIIAPTKEEVTEIDYKMVIVVRKDLKMKPGKMAAQVGHGVLAAYKRAVQTNLKEVSLWEDFGQPKIVLKINGESDILELQKKAQEAGLVAETIRDAGRTQIAPNSLTVCAIGPGRSDTISEVTGHLKLY